MENKSDKQTHKNIVNTSHTCTVPRSSSNLIGALMHLVHFLNPLLKCITEESITASNLICSIQEILYSVSNLTILYRSFTTYSNPLKGFHQRAFFFEVQKYNVCHFLSGPDKARDVVRLRIVSCLVAYDRRCLVSITLLAAVTFHVGDLSHRGDSCF